MLGTDAVLLLANIGLGFYYCYPSLKLVFFDLNYYNNLPAVPIFSAHFFSKHMYVQ
jgi:hypothetical protein